MKEGKLSRQQIYQIIVAFALGIGIVYWLYKDFDFSEVVVLLKYNTNWGWMIASLLFGVLSHVVRGLRWKLALKPLGESPKTSNCINAIFISYLSNMIIPRLGELSRCGVLKKYDNISFSKSLGSVVAERFIDTICITVLSVATIFIQASLFKSFFHKTGLRTFLVDWKMILVISACLVFIALFCYYLIKRLHLSSRFQKFIENMWAGFAALKSMGRSSWMYIFYTILMWLSYYLHFFLTFYCFGFTENLGAMAGLALFIVGSIAVIVPTPNGAGPWHFAIITMLTLYGVTEVDARIFALIVHTIQSFLVILLGMYGFLALPLFNKNQEK